jgi:hypothetical protein
VTASVAVAANRAIETTAWLGITATATLTNLTSLEPAHRPPIA